MVSKSIKLFISYRSSDAGKVDEIARNLALLKNKNGTLRFETWQDKHNLPPASPNWWDEIVNAIIGCDVFVFFVSLGSLQSEVCQAELDYAYRRNRLIIPVVLDGEYEFRPDAEKHDLKKEYWDLFPDWLKETQLLFFIGADFYDKFGQIIDRFERNPPLDVKFRRPLDPAKNKNWINHSIYAKACDYAGRLAFVEADDLFRQLLRRNDEVYADIAGEWIFLLNSYYDLIEMKKANSSRYIFNAKLKDYLSLFPKEFLDGEIFDPEGFAQDFEEPLKSPLFPIWILSAVAVVLLALIVGIWGLSSLIGGADDPQSVAQQVTNTPTDEPPPEPTQTPSETTTPTNTANPTAVEETLQALETVIAHEGQQTLDAISTQRADAIIVAEQETADSLTSIAESWTPTNPPDLRASAEARSTQNAQATIDAQGTVNADATQTQDALDAEGTANANATETQIAFANSLPELREKTRFIDDSRISAIALSPQGDLLASGSDTSFRLWNLEQKIEITNFRQRMNNVEDVVFNFDGTLIAIATLGDGVSVINAETNQTINNFENRLALSVMFSPDGTLLASGGCSQLKIWSMESGENIFTFSDVGDCVNGISFSPDGEFLAFGSADSNVRIIEVGSWDIIETINVGLPVGGGVSFSPDGNLLAFSDIAGNIDDDITLWDVQTGEEILQFGENILNIAFDPSGRILASAGFDGFIRLWDIETGVQLLELLAHEGDVGGYGFEYVTDVVFSQDGTLIATSGFDGIIRIWEIK